MQFELESLRGDSQGRRPTGNQFLRSPMRQGEQEIRGDGQSLRRSSLLCRKNIVTLQQQSSGRYETKIYIQIFYRRHLFLYDREPKGTNNRS